MPEDLPTIGDADEERAAVRVHEAGDRLDDHQLDDLVALLGGKVDPGRLLELDASALAARR